MMRYACSRSLKRDRLRSNPARSIQTRQQSRLPSNRAESIHRSVGSNGFATARLSKMSLETWSTELPHLFWLL